MFPLTECSPSVIVMEMIHDLTAAIIRDGKVPLTGSRVSLSASTRVRGMHWKGATSVVSTDRAGHESLGEDCGRPHQTVGINRGFPVWLHPKQRHRCNLCCQAAAREVFSCQQQTLHGFHRPKEAFDRVPQKIIWWVLRKLGVE